MQCAPVKQENHDNHDGKKVWLTIEEINLLLSMADTTQKKIAFSLGAQSGLRIDEITSVTPRDVIETPVGPFVRVQHGKGDKYRETPITTDLKATCDAVADIRPESDSEPFVQATNRTVRNWIYRAAAKCKDETNDHGWDNLSPHDLRRSWGTLLVNESDVERGLIMDWGGWDNWETFRDEYLGVYSLQQQKKQMEKVAWL